jgi:uncharacterized protein
MQSCATIRVLAHVCAASTEAKAGRIERLFLSSGRPPALPNPISPVCPTESAGLPLAPIGLGGVVIDGGLWGERRRVNRGATIPTGLERLEAAGNLENFRLAARGASAGYAVRLDDSGTAFPFLDSDVYKWLEAVGWSLAEGADAELLALAEPVLELVCSAQRADGYLNTYVQLVRGGRPYGDLQWGHELYCVGHLVQAAVAWHRATGDDRLLRVAERAVGHVHEAMGPGNADLVDGHPGIEMALVELYRATGAERPLELAQTFIERRGRGLLGSGRFGAPYWQDHLPVRLAKSPAGHAVRQVYLDSGAVDVAVETGDRDLLEAVVLRHQVMTATRTHLTGGLGSRHRDESFGDPWELPPDRAYAETCAAIGSVGLAWRLLLATGDVRLADQIERTALNAVLPGLSLDGRSFFYSNPLQLRAAGSQVLEGARATRRAAWFACACCPPNLMRFLAAFPDLVATTDGRGIKLLQYVSGSVRAAVPGGEAQLRIRTDYPWAERIEIIVERVPVGPWTLGLRIPSWARSSVVRVNGATAQQASASPDGLSIGFASIDRVWHVGDLVELEVPMAVRVTVPDPRIDALRGTVAVERGPVVYAIESSDLPPDASTDAVSAPRTLLEEPVLAPVPGLGDIPSIQVTLAAMTEPAESGVRAPETSLSDWPYTDSVAVRPEPDRRLVRARLVPYFTWGNRGSGGMRIWLPTLPTGSTPASAPERSQGHRSRGSQAPHEGRLRP